MDASTAATSPAHLLADRQARGRQLRRGALLSALFVMLLGWIHLAQAAWGPFDALALRPRDLAGLVGVLTAPLLHADTAHLFSNALPTVILGTLALGLYPKASRRMLPLLWIGGTLLAWTFARPNLHLGASGLGHGLMVFVAVAGLLRRDRPAIAASLVALFLYGGMLFTVLPGMPRVSWEMHAAGALMGLVAAIAWHRLDPAPARLPYSWELEEQAEAARIAEGLEHDRPSDVPVLWHGPTPPERGVVLVFRRPGPPPPPPSMD